MAEVFWCSKAQVEATACPFGHFFCGRGQGDLNCVSTRKEKAKEKKQKTTAPTGESLVIPVQPVDVDADKSLRNVTNSNTTIGRIRSPKLK